MEIEILKGKSKKSNKKDSGMSNTTIILIACISVAVLILAIGGLIYYKLRG
jgi:hypothetical protein